MSASKRTVRSYGEMAIPHLGRILDSNQAVMERLKDRLVADVSEGKGLLVFGSGHSGLFPLELYHRAGGASFVHPLVADYLLPNAGPPVIRVLERTPGVANVLLARAKPKSGEMIWIGSQSGINGAVVDFALEAKKRGLHTVAFTSVAHSSAVQSRHPSGKRLFEVCDETVDLGGFRGDACVEIASGLSAGPLSMLGSVFLGHSIVVAACAELEARGVRCTYTSVNTPEGEERNKELERVASERDPLLLG
jgi:uncharacterized phosphosugar-binding protein